VFDIEFCCDKYTVLTAAVVSVPISTATCMMQDFAFNEGVCKIRIHGSGYGPDPFHKAESWIRILSNWIRIQYIKPGSGSNTENPDPDLITKSGYNA
jgi:hypothetical protein